MNTPTLRPIRDQIVCLRIEAPEKVGSIFLPEKARQQTNQVEIVAIGPDVKASLTVGQRGYIGNFAGADVEIDDEKYVIIPENDLLAVLD